MYNDWSIYDDLVKELAPVVKEHLTFLESWIEDSLSAIAWHCDNHIEFCVRWKMLKYKLRSISVVTSWELTIELIQHDRSVRIMPLIRSIKVNSWGWYSYRHHHGWEIISWKYWLSAFRWENAIWQSLKRNKWSYYVIAEILRVW